MKSFNEVYTLVDQSSHETAYPRAECLELYNILLSLPNGARIIEVGVEFGRSTTVIAEVGLEKNFDFTGIDNWSWEHGARAKAHVEKRIEDLGWKMMLVTADSVQAAKFLKGDLDLIHIDGDHDFREVYKDCVAWGNHVKPGGYMLFDDYGHPGLDGVKRAAELYFGDKPHWEFLGQKANKLGVYRRIS